MWLNSRRFLLALAFLGGCAQSPIAMREMGSFHIGGREVEISGKTVKEIVFTPGSVPATIDPNGKYLVESMSFSTWPPTAEAPCPFCCGMAAASRM